MTGIQHIFEKVGSPPYTNISNFFGRSIPSNCKQVTTFARKVRNPAVGVFTLVIFKGTTLLTNLCKFTFLFSSNGNSLDTRFLSSPSKLNIGLCFACY